MASRLTVPPRGAVMAASYGVAAPQQHLRADVRDRRPQRGQPLPRTLVQKPQGDIVSRAAPGFHRQQFWSHSRDVTGDPEQTRYGNTATVPAPSSYAARIARMAISPRLAARTLENIAISTSSLCRRCETKDHARHWPRRKEAPMPGSGIGAYRDDARLVSRRKWCRASPCGRLP
jgi:hypothetical protein